MLIFTLLTRHRGEKLYFFPPYLFNIIPLHIKSYKYFISTIFLACCCFVSLFLVIKSFWHLQRFSKFLLIVVKNERKKTFSLNLRFSFKHVTKSNKLSLQSCYCESLLSSFFLYVA